MVFEIVTCEVHKVLDLEWFLFLVSINALPNAWKILYPIMFVDDANIFCSHHNTKLLFSTINKEMESNR